MSDSSPFDPTTTTYLAGWLEETQAYTALAEAARSATKTALFDALARAGITTVVLAFDGSCDEGQIEAVTALAGESPVDLPSEGIAVSEPRRDGSGLESRTYPLAEAIETMAYAFLEETHDGWEINDGAFGCFTFDVAARSIRLAYNERVVETDYSECVF